MFKVEIKNLSISANIGITAQERKKKQLLKVTLEFIYPVKNSLDLNNINNVKDYSSITKYLKQEIQDNESTFFKTILEQLEGNMQQTTSADQKERLSKWIQKNAQYFNNKGAFDKLYPEFSRLI